MAVLPAKVAGAGNIERGRGAHHSRADGAIGRAILKHFVAEHIARLKGGTVDGELKGAARIVAKNRDGTGPGQIIEGIVPGLARSENKLAVTGKAESEDCANENDSFHMQTPSA